MLGPCTTTFVAPRQYSHLTPLQMSRLVQHYQKSANEESRAAEARRVTAMQSVQRKGRFSVARVRRRCCILFLHSFTAVRHAQAGPDTQPRPLQQHVPLSRVRTTVV